MLSVTQAFRNDLADDWHDIGMVVRFGLIVGSLLEHAARASDDQRERLWDAVRAQAKKAIGQREAERQSWLQWNGPNEFVADLVFLLATAVQEAGALHLADAIASNALASDADMGLVQQGRLIALRASVALKHSLVDAADDWYRQVERLGRGSNSDELVARAALGRATLAFHRGNMPEMARQSRRAAGLAARSGLARLEHQARLGLVIDAAKRRQFDRALAEAWAMHECSGDDVALRAADTQTIGELLLNMGETEAARKVLRWLVAEQLPARVMMPALGGLAIASARLSDDVGLNWVLTQVSLLARAVVPRYPYVQALVECAEALVAAKRRSDATIWRDRSLQLARHHAFHELAFRAEAIDLDASPTLPRFRRRRTTHAHSVFSFVGSIRSRGLPARVRLAPTVTT